MSLETVSEKRNRIYQRKFDHDEARRLHSEGMSYQSLAERYGVTPTAVQRVCDPLVRSRMDETIKAYIERRRRPCLGGCGRRVWMHQQEGVRSGYCRQCLNAKHAAEHPDIRATELRCTRCREWKADSEFPTYHPVKARRGRNPMCKACAAAARREHRARFPEQTRDIDQRSKAKRGELKVQAYIVLQNGTPGEYREVARVDAVSAKHAVEQTVIAEGEYIAVPISRFAPMRVAPVREFRVVAEEPTAA